MQAPGDPPPSAERWVSFDEARMILRMSEGTLRRAIKAGTVKAELRRRNPDSPTDQRMVYEVLITDPPASATAPESPSATAPVTEPPALTTQALDIMDALLRANGETIGGQAETIAELRERVGRLDERATAAEARAADLAERLTQAEAKLAARRWWRFWGRR